jgi:predicted metal-dependent phosphoesterase TrpH
MLHRYDLHTHSNLSDGTDSPEEIVEAAGKEGLKLIAITDHDTLSGVRDAMAAGERAGVLVIPGIEFNTKYTGELHILGFCIDVENSLLLEAASFAKKAREIRNQLIYEKLTDMGYDLSEVFRKSRGTTTRLNFALALRDAGYAGSVREAFETLLSPGAPAYVSTERIAPERAIEIIHEAGGVAVLAHPCKLQGDTEQLISGLVRAGLDGLEVYYPRSTEEQTKQFLNVARG